MSLGRIGIVAALVVGLASTPTAFADGASPSTDSASWRLTAVPQPGGGVIATDVAPELACAATGFCAMATAERYLTTLAKGVARTVRAPVFKPGYVERITDVACAAIDQCTALGISRNPGEGDISGGAGYREELGGTAWTAEAGSRDLDAVCSAERCVAYGTWDQGVPRTYIDDRDAGASWVSRQIVTPWRPAGYGFYTAVYSVSCPPSGACAGVGYGIDDHALDRPLFLYRSGEVWKAVVQALPPGADPYRSEGARTISCAADRNCVGLGTYVDMATQQIRPFAEVLDDGVLSAMAVPMPATAATGRRVYAGGIDCPTVTVCAGVAGWTGHGGRSVLLRYHGGMWSYRVAPAPADTAAGTRPGIRAVSCASAAVCVAIGGYIAATSTGRVVQPASWTRADGRWTVRAVAPPAGANATDGGSLTAIECPGVHRCYAVGTYGGVAVYGIGRLSS